MTKLSYTNLYGELIELTAASYEEAQKIINENYVDGIQMSNIVIASDEQKCRICGCDQEHACKGGCSWVEADLCSQCYEKLNSFTVTLCNIKVINKNSYKEISERKVIADELESFDKAEGFIYGYIEGKAIHQYVDDEDLEPGKVYLMAELASESQIFEATYFFKEEV
jgi:hypothetical protein